MQKKYTPLAITSLFILSLVILPMAASAQVSAGTSAPANMGMREGVFKGKGFMGMRGHNSLGGKVTAINGTTLTITDRKSQTYTVDASGAKFLGGMMGMQGLLPTPTIANVMAGDLISIQGTLTGTNIVATSVNDMSIVAREMFMGKVTAVNGNTISMTGKNGSLYTVDASSAKLVKGFGKNQTTILITDIKVGDNITVIGTANGQNITATVVSEKGNHSFFKKAFGFFKGKGKAN